MWQERLLVARNDVVKKRERWRPPATPEGMVWLFVATLPNAGSTALTRLVTTSPDVFTLEGRGEAQWLVPQLSRKGSRWDPDHRVDYDLVRAVWLDRARQRARGRSVVLEKSPSNIVRMAPLLAAFADLAPRLVVFTRDPLAVCASWARRKTPQVIVENWMPTGTPVPADERAFFTLLGDTCGRRMAYLAQMLDQDSLHVSYEAVAQSPATFADRLRAFVPEIGALDTAATLRGVKDYPDQPITNMNAEQIARLSPEQRSWLRAALEPWAQALDRLGYSVGA